MPRNGSGIYGPPPGTAAVPNTTIESADYNAVVADMSQALTESVNVGGTTPFQANQSMGNNKLIAMAPGTAAGDSVNLAQAQSAIVAHATSVGGTADAITASFSPAFTAYAAKMRFRFTALGSSTVVSPIVNVDGLGAKMIKKLNSVPLAIGDIGGAGHVCDCIYDGADVLLLNPALIAGDRANTFTAKQTFNGPVVKGATALTDATTIAWDLSTGADFRVTITSNRTLGPFTNGTVGQEGTFTIAQDGTGGWSLNLGNAVYHFWGPSIENIARGANEETVYEYKVISAGSMFLRRKGATSIGGPGRDLLATFTASSSATIDIVLSKWLSLYDRFEIDFEDVQAASNNAAFHLRTSTNGGATYDSGSSDYKWVWERLKVGTHDINASSGDDKIVMISNDDSQGLSNVVGETAAGTVDLNNPRASAPAKVSWRTIHVPDNAASFIDRYDGVGVRSAAANVDAVRLFPSIGNITSGDFRLFGVRN
jgi:hypothetical protein